MKRQTTRYRISSFGNDRDYDDVDALMAGLTDHYAGCSVAIHVLTTTGMIHCLFVDVTGQGDILETYPQNAEVSRVSRDMISCVAG